MMPAAPQDLAEKTSNSLCVSNGEDVIHSGFWTFIARLTMMRRMGGLTRRRSDLICAGAAFLFVAVAPAIAQVTPAATDGAIEQLKPGQFLWAPDIAPEGPVTLIVEVRRPLMFLSVIPSWSKLLNSENIESRPK